MRSPSRASLLRPALLCVLAALTVGGAGGCAALTAEPGPHVRTGAGEVTTDWRTRRNLHLLQHTHRRDDRGHLVVFLELQNVSDDDYIARVWVKFADADGLLERGAYDSDERRFAPGRTQIEWTSSTTSATSYVVELRSGRLLQW